MSGETMLLPTIIFLMILFPVLVPAAVTLAHTIMGTNQPATMRVSAARRLATA
jgi:hypothetical protein